MNRSRQSATKMSSQRTMKRTRAALGSRRPSARRRFRNIDHRHALFLVIPAMEALDAGHVDLVRAEKTRHVNGCRFIGLTNLGRSLRHAIERFDSDDLSLLVVVEIRAALASQTQH